jgi:nondiscriminating glutamyl-tRNA synthetase
MKHAIRVRFAPSPTGLLHLGSVRTALFNYLFAHQKNGTFVLRIEDTDPERNFDPGATIILKDLKWLNLLFDEGPEKGGPYAPYFQSQRSDLYASYLELLKEKNRVYRCFCASEDLEKKRERQIALKKPPRYDRTCLTLSQETITNYLEQKKPFMWRFKINSDQIIQIKDLVRGTINFDFKNFSDFPLTRQNGTFTFLFANAVDDIVMKISHIFRGEDHISNTPCQAALYEAFEVEIPLFWHMPIMCNVDGKKLSKRDFGFSLRDLKDGGFLPEAICNYLAIIGASFEHEIMELDQLVNVIDFTQLHSSGAIKYDLEKLTWVNHQWLLRYPHEKLIMLILPFLIKEYPEAEYINKKTLLNLITLIQPELKTLKDASRLLAFYFKSPQISKNDLLEYVTQPVLDAISSIITSHINTIDSPDAFFNAVKCACKEQNILSNLAWKLLRIMLTGSPSGPGIKELLLLLGPDETKKRIQNAL